MRKKLFYTLAGLLLLFTVQGQNFTHEVSYELLQETGFYNLLLTPEITAHLNERFSDLRIYNGNGTEIGYILRAEESEQTTQFIEYKIVENIHHPGCCSNLILENPDANPINNIQLEIRNSEVSKKARLTGSDDGSSWFTIKDSYHLISLFSEQNISKIVNLHFPLSRYRFYKLEINDSASAPLNIIKAGYWDSHKEDVKYLKLPDSEIQQIDSSDKKSYIFIRFPTRQYLQKLTFEFEGPVPYYRKVWLYLADSTDKIISPISEQIFKSGDAAFTEFPGVFSKSLCLIVENNDNLPLRFKKISGYQLMHYLTARLEQNQKYTLRFGNSQLPFPEYDLQYFRDSLSQVRNTLLPSTPKKISPLENTQEELKPSETWWIWISIAAIGLLLAFMSVRMLREIKEN